MARPLRILVAHNVPRARIGGMSRLMGFIHDRVERRGHEVDYMCSDDVPPVARGRAGRLLFPLFVRGRAVAAARAGRPYQVINIHEPSASGLLFKRSSFASSSVVLMSHSPERRVWEELLSERRLGRLSSGEVSRKTRILYPLTSLTQSDLGFRFADHVFCRNSVDRDYIRGRYSVPAAKMTMVYAGADTIYASAGDKRSYERAERLVFPGTWLPRKGIVDLVSAFETLAQRHALLTLTIIGSGTNADSIREVFSEGCRERVFCSPINATDQEHAASFASGDIYVFPTLSEGGTLTLAEGMMSGLPIVTTNVCGMTDVIRHQENGLLVPIRSPDAIVDAVERLISDRDLRERLGRTARQDALAKYTWDEVSRPVIEAYESLCPAG